MIFRKERLEQPFCECGDIHASFSSAFGYKQFDLFSKVHEVESRKESLLKLSKSFWSDKIS